MMVHITTAFRVSLGVVILAVCSQTFLMTHAPSMGCINTNETWRKDMIRKLWVERKEMNHTPLIKYQHPFFKEITLYLKNEGNSKTGSLKHRFAWAMFMWAITDGHVKQGTTVFEASSGNTAVSEAYMAQLLGIPFVAVLSSDAQAAKIHAIKSYGGSVIVANGSSIVAAAEEVAKDPANRFFMNQYANAERAEEYYESGDYTMESTNVMHEILHQISESKGGINTSYLQYFVAGAGTGGTMTSVGRYVNRYNLDIACILADIQYSAFYDWVLNGHFGGNESAADQYVAPGIPGVGYARMGPLNYGVTTSLLPLVLTKAVKVPDLGSVAAMLILRDVTGVVSGPSSGTNFLVALHMAVQLREKHGANRTGAIATLLCDEGGRYLDTYYNKTWLDIGFKEKGGVKALDCYKKQIEIAMASGVDPLRILGLCMDQFQTTENSTNMIVLSSASQPLLSSSSEVHAQTVIYVTSSFIVSILFFIQHT